MLKKFPKYLNFKNISKNVFVLRGLYVIKIYDHLIVSLKWKQETFQIDLITFLFPLRNGPKSDIKHSTRFLYKEYFYKQHQTEIGKKLSKN